MSDGFSTELLNPPTEALKRQETLRSLHDLALVRALSGPPRVRNNGIYLPTAYQATRGSVPRITLHFTLNDLTKNTADGAGRWTNQDHVVVSPFMPLAEHSEIRVVNISPIDTFFEVPIETDFVMPPSAILIQPFPREFPDGIRRVSDAHWQYQSGGYSQDFISRLHGQLDEDTMAELKSDLATTLTGFDDPRIQAILIRHFPYIYDYTDALIEKHGRLENQLFERGIAQMKKNILALPESAAVQRDFSAEGISLEGHITSSLERAVRAAFRRQITRDALRAQGFPVIKLGQHDWIDQEATKKLQEFCNEHGWRLDEHVLSIWDTVETILIAVQDGEISKDEAGAEIRSMADTLTPALRQLVKREGIL